MDACSCSFVSSLCSKNKWHDASHLSFFSDPKCHCTSQLDKQQGDSPSPENSKVVHMISVVLYYKASILVKKKKALSFPTLVFNMRSHSRLYLNSSYFVSWCICVIWSNWHIWFPDAEQRAWESWRCKASLSPCFKWKLISEFLQSGALLFALLGWTEPVTSYIWGMQFLIFLYYIYAFRY